MIEMIWVAAVILVGGVVKVLRLYFRDFDDQEMDAYAPPKTHLEPLSFFADMNASLYNGDTKMLEQYGYDVSYVCIPAATQAFDESQLTEGGIISSRYDVALTTNVNAQFIYAENVTIQSAYDVTSGALVAAHSIQACATLFHVPLLAAGVEVRLNTRGFFAGHIQAPLISINQNTPMTTFQAELFHMQQALKYERDVLHLTEETDGEDAPKALGPMGGFAQTTTPMAGTTEIPPYSEISQDIYCTGDLHIGEGCVFHGKLRVGGSLYSKESCTYFNTIIVEQEAVFGPCAGIHGVLIVKGALHAEGLFLFGLGKEEENLVAAQKLQFAGGCVGSGLMVSQSAFGIRST